MLIAQRRDHLAVRLARPDAHAQPGAGDQQEQADRDKQPRHDDRQPIDRIGRDAGQGDRARKQRRHVQEQGRRAEDPARRLGKNQDQREGRQHLVQVIARIKPADHHHLDDRARRRRRRQRRRQPQPERPRRRRDRRAGERAHHVERAVRQVDKPHDAEDQRQAGRHQEQHDPILQAVQRLLEEKRRAHGAARTQPKEERGRERPPGSRINAAYIWHSAS